MLGSIRPRSRSSRSSSATRNSQPSSHTSVSRPETPAEMTTAGGHVEEYLLRLGSHLDTAHNFRPHRPLDEDQVPRPRRQSQPDPILMAGLERVKAARKRNADTDTLRPLGGDNHGPSSDSGNSSTGTSTPHNRAGPPPTASSSSMTAYALAPSPFTRSAVGGGTGSGSGSVVDGNDAYHHPTTAAALTPQLNNRPPSTVDSNSNNSMRSPSCSSTTTTSSATSRTTPPRHGDSPAAFGSRYAPAKPSEKARSATTVQGATDNASTDDGA